MDIEIKNFRRRFERKFGKVVGHGSWGLQIVSFSLKEVGNLPRGRGCLDCVPEHKNRILLICSCFC